MMPFQHLVATGTYLLSRYMYMYIHVACFVPLYMYHFATLPFAAFCISAPRPSGTALATCLGSRAYYSSYVATYIYI